MQEIKLKNNKINKISLLGITFKGNPDTNDIRNSTAITIISILRKKFPKKKIYVYDKFVDNIEIKKLNCIPLKKSKNVLLSLSCALFTEIIIILKN